MELDRIKKFLPNFFTLCNMTMGIIVIFVMIYSGTLHARRVACFLIYIAAIFDFLDGCLARYFDVVSDMGRQLDSFADIVTFGLAPFAVFMANLQYLNWTIKLSLLFYIFAGAFRLSRYNLQKQYEYIIGLPITVSGFILATVLFINSYIQIEYTEIFLDFFFLLSLILSVMMVSKFRLDKRWKT